MIFLDLFLGQNNNKKVMLNKTNKKWKEGRNLIVKLKNFNAAYIKLEYNFHRYLSYSKIFEENINLHLNFLININNRRKNRKFLDIIMKVNEKLKIASIL